MFEYTEQLVKDEFRHYRTQRNGAVGKVERMEFRIRQMRKDRNWTLEELGELAGVSKSHLSALERGVDTININRLEGIARAFGVRAYDLIIPPDGDPMPPTALAQTPHPNKPVLVVRGGAGAVFHDELGPAIGITLEDASAGEAKYLLREGEARNFYARIGKGLAKIEDSEEQQASSVVAS